MLEIRLMLWLLRENSEVCQKQDVVQKVGYYLKNKRGGKKNISGEDIYKRWSENIKVRKFGVTRGSLLHDNKKNII